MVSISTASEDLRSDACTPDRTILTLQVCVETAYEAKMVEILIVAVQNYFCLPNSFLFFFCFVLFLNAYLCYNTTLSSVDYLFFPRKTQAL